MRFVNSVLYISTFFLFSTFLISCSDSSGWSPVPVPPYSDLNGAGNYHNYGLSVSDGTWTYYSMLVFDLEKQDELVGIYRTRSDGSGGDERIYDRMALNLFIIDNKLYFTETTNDEDSKETLVRMNTDTTDKETVLTLDSYDFKDLTYYEGYFYYILNERDENDIDMGKIYKFPKDGGTPEQIGTDDVYTMGVGEGWVYYHNHDDNKLYRMKVDGSMNEEIIDHAVDSIIVYNERLYYIDFYNSDSAATCDLDGSDPVILLNGSTGPVDHINVADDYVYMARNSIKNPSNDGLFRIHTDGTGYEALKSNTEYFNDPNMNISAGKLYCVNMVPFMIGLVPSSYFRINTDGTGYELLWGVLD